MAVFGFIGIGNMGGAIAQAMAQISPAQEIIVSAAHQERAEKFAQLYEVIPGDNETIAREAHFLFLGVKPHQMEGVLRTLKPILEVRTDCVLITMAAGLTTNQISSMVGGGYPVIRIMPNIPVEVGQGLVLYSANERVRPEDLEGFRYFMSFCGQLVPLAEEQIDAGSALSGSGPAFVSLFLEALADGAVACGLPRKIAMECALEMLRGTAAYLSESGDEPSQLKDTVCSPGGSTIQGVRALEQGGFRSSVMEAVIAAYEKNREFMK